MPLLRLKISGESRSVAGRRGININLWDIGQLKKFSESCGFDLYTAFLYTLLYYTSAVMDYALCRSFALSTLNNNLKKYQGSFNHVTFNYDRGQMIGCSCFAYLKLDLSSRSHMFYSSMYYFLKSCRFQQTSFYPT